MLKLHKIAAEDIKPLVEGYGECFASDMITVDGLPVGFMYREEPDYEDDSGWRFLNGSESDEYMEELGNYGVFEVNTIANYDPTIIPFLDATIGSAFEKTPGAATFIAVTDWELPEK